MDLVYTVYKHRSGGCWSQKGGRLLDPLPEASLCTVSSQNVVAFTGDLPSEGRPGGEADFGGKGVYCADLNNPWEYNLVYASSARVTSVAWDGSGTKLCIGDQAGNIIIRRMVKMNLSEWTDVHTTVLPNETILKIEFLSSARVIRLNSERRDSKFYTEKFQCAPEKDGVNCSEVCVVLTKTSLLYAVSLMPTCVSASVCVGINRALISYADIGVSTGGDILLAVSCEEKPVVIYKLTFSLKQDNELQVNAYNHSSFTVHSLEKSCNSVDQKEVKGSGNSTETRVMGIKFVLTDSSDAILVGMDNHEGGKVKMWELCTSMQACHKIFAPSIHSPKRKKIHMWRPSAEFSAGGARLNAFTSPRISVVGGNKPACYIVVAFSDGSIQCLIRDSLQQIASVELPRSGIPPQPLSSEDGAEQATAGNSDFHAFGAITSMAFTSTATGLVVMDNHGQLYLYRMSPIADPGGPHVAAYLVTMYEYCLMSGQDWWDLSLASAQTNIQSVIDKLEETFGCQPLGVKNFCFNRFMSIKSSLYRLMPHGEYRAGDSLSMQLLTSIHSHMTSLLSTESTSSVMDKSPADKFESIVRGLNTNPNLDNVVSNLVTAGLSRELHASDEIQALISLGNWVVVLALHILSAKPEFKTRRGPGFWIIQDGGLEVIREIVVLLRLWAFPRPAITSREKDMDLNGKVYSMVTRLREKPEDDNLLDECLILPSLVIIPSLDTLVSPVGVLSKLHSGLSIPFAFHYGIEPNLPVAGQHVFLEGLNYTQDFNSNQIYDCIGKRVLGKCLAIRSCNRCKSFTKVPSTSKEESACGTWEKRWTKSCHCGGTWNMVTQ